MNISIYNFKSIKELVNFEIKPFTILSGVNSSGKSSFIQLLLLLKQTIDRDSSRISLDLEGDLYTVRENKDILFGKNFENKLKIAFEFDKSEFKKKEITTPYDLFEDYKYIIEIEYEFDEEQEFISGFVIRCLPENDNVDEKFIVFNTNKKDGYQYSIKTNHQTYTDFAWVKIPPISDIKFSSIYPEEYEALITKYLEDEDRKLIETKEPERSVLRNGEFKQILDSFFRNISYIGPLREEPKDEYPTSRNSNYVGSQGESVAQVLQKNADLPIEFNTIKEIENGIEYETNEGNLLEAVNYWMCEEFKVAKQISAQKRGDYYQITLDSENGLTTTIKHVGFGISQLLPIIVEGLKVPSDGVLILEQPEIHLHPKYQSLLFDFLFGLTLQGKTVIIETHSDHIINRMRRRIAEDSTNKMHNKINLTFIETRKRENNFRTLDLDEYGSLDYFPVDFIDQTDNDLRAIVKAQMKKKTQK